ncbi:MAG: RidA family protein [Gemmatimonadales bacterium]
MTKLHALGPAVLALLTACSIEAHRETADDQTSSPEYIAPPGGNSELPFSDAVRVGNMLYLSGRIGSIPGEGLVKGGIQPETRQALENVKMALERNGASMDRVVKCTVMLADIAEWASMNEIYREFFPTNKPARSAFGTSGLAAGARVEIECMAVLE